MAQHPEVLAKFYETLSIGELVKLRYEARKLGDEVTKEMLDHEFKRRELALITPAKKRR